MRKQVGPRFLELDFMYMELRNEIDLFNKLIRSFEEITFTSDDLQFDISFKKTREEIIKGHPLIPNKLRNQIALVNKTEWYSHFQHELQELYYRLANSQESKLKPIKELLSRKGLLPFLNNTSNAIRFKIDVVLPTLLRLIKYIERYLKKCLNKKKTKIKKDRILSQIAQLEETKLAIKIKKEILAENIVMRLKLAVIKLDMRYDDMAFSIENQISQMNNRLKSSIKNDSLPAQPTVPRRSLSATNFYSFHRYINNYTIQGRHPSLQKHYQKLVEHYDKIGKQGPIRFTTTVDKGIPIAIPTALEEEIPRYRFWPAWLFAGNNLRYNFFRHRFYELTTINCHYQLIQNSLRRFTDFQDLYEQFHQAVTSLEKLLEMAKKSLINGWFRQKLNSHANNFLLEFINICYTCQKKIIQQKLIYLNKSLQYFKNNSEHLLNYLIYGNNQQAVIHLYHLQQLVINIEKESCTKTPNENTAAVKEIKEKYIAIITTIIRNMMQKLLTVGATPNKAELETIIVRLKVLSLLDNAKRIALENIIQVIRLNKEYLSKINLVNELEILFPGSAAQNINYSNRILERYLLPYLTDCHSLEFEFVNRQNPKLNWLLIQTQESAELIIHLFMKNPEQALSVTNRPFLISWETWKSERDTVNDESLLTLEKAIEHIEFLFYSHNDDAINRVIAAIKNYLTNYRGDNLIYSQLISASKIPELIKFYVIKLFSRLLETKSYREIINNAFINQQANANLVNLLKEMRDLLTNHINNRAFDYSDNNFTDLIQLLCTGFRHDLVSIVIDDFLDKYDIKMQYTQSFLQDVSQCQTFLLDHLQNHADDASSNKKTLLTQLDHLQSILEIEKNYCLFIEFMQKKDSNNAFQLINCLICQYHNNLAINESIHRTAQLSLTKIIFYLRKNFIETIFYSSIDKNKMLPISLFKQVIAKINSESFPHKLEINQLKFLSEHNYAIRHDSFALIRQLEKLVKLNPFEQVLNFNVAINQDLLITLSFLPEEKVNQLEKLLSELFNQQDHRQNPWSDVLKVIQKAVNKQAIIATESNLIENFHLFKNYLCCLINFDKKDNKQIMFQEIAVSLLHSQYGNFQYRAYWSQWISFFNRIACDYDFTQLCTHFHIHVAEINNDKNYSRESHSLTFKCPAYLRIAKIIGQHETDELISDKHFRFIYKNYYQNAKLLLTPHDIENKEKIKKLLNTAVHLIADINSSYIDKTPISVYQLANYCNIIRFFGCAKQLKSLEIIIEDLLLTLFKYFISGIIDCNLMRLMNIIENIVNNQQLHFFRYIKLIENDDNKLSVPYQCSTTWLALCCKILLQIIEERINTDKTAMKSINISHVIKQLKIIKYNYYNLHKITSEHIPEIIISIDKIIIDSHFSESVIHLKKIKTFFENIVLNNSELHFIGYKHTSSINLFPPIYIFTQRSTQSYFGV